MRYYEIPIKTPYYFSLEISFHSPGLTNFNPQEGHTSSEGRTCVYIYSKPQRNIFVLCALLKVMSCSLQTFYLLIILPYYVL